jgi:hypothetical protein
VVDGPTFPLRIGLVGHPASYGEPQPRETTGFRVDPDRARYEVSMFVGGTLEEVGPCEVHHLGGDQFTVRPEFTVSFPWDDCKFWGAFRADEAGMATLESVYLVVRAP